MPDDGVGHEVDGLEGVDAHEGVLLGVHKSSLDLLGVDSFFANLDKD